MLGNHIPLEVFKVIVETSPIGAYIWSIENKVNVLDCINVFANKAASEAVGVDLSSIVGGAVKDTFPNISETSLPDTFTAAVATGESKRILNFSYGDEKIKDSNFIVDVLPLNEKYIAILFTNITPQIKAEKELKTKVKELERMNEAMVDRELKMIELKKEINKLQSTKSK